MAAPSESKDDDPHYKQAPSGVRRPWSAMRGAMMVAVRRTYELAISLLLPLALHAQPRCTPPTVRLSYPAAAMEQKTSGPVLLSFSVDGRGAPRNIAATGDPLLAAEVKFAFRYVQFPRQCSGTEISIAVTFRIDPALPIQAPVAVRQPSGTEYEVISPDKTLVVISDPPVTWIRPGKMFVEVWRGGDDGLTQRLGDALQNAFDNSRDFTPSTGGKPGTVIVSVPSNVGWKQFGNRTQVRFSIDFKNTDGATIGRSEGRCWEDAVAACAARVLRDLKRTAGKISGRSRL